MQYEIVTIKTKVNEFGKNDLIISKVKLTDDSGKYIKFVKLDEELIEEMKKNPIHIKV